MPSFIFHFRNAARDANNRTHPLIFVEYKLSPKTSNQLPEQKTQTFELQFPTLFFSLSLSLIVYGETSMWVAGTDNTVAVYNVIPIILLPRFFDVKVILFK